MGLERTTATAGTLLFTAALAFALAGNGCAPSRRAVVYRKLHAATDTLMMAGRLEEAVRALDDVSERRSERSAARWERTWARARARSLMRMLALPARGRAELAATARPAPASVDEDSDDWVWVRPALERQLEARRRWLPPEAPDLAETMTALARLERVKGDPWRAHLLNIEALRIRRAAFGEGSPEVAESQMMLGRDLKRSGVAATNPEAYLDSALTIRRKLFGATSLEYAECLKDRANIHRWRHEVDPALREFEQVRAIRERVEGPRSAGVAEVLADLAVTHMRRENWAEMERLSRVAVAILEERHATSASTYGFALSLRGLALRHLHRYTEARRVLERACAVQEARRRLAPQDDYVRAQFYPIGSSADLAMVQLLTGDSLAAWLTQERALNRRWAERAWARGEVDSVHAWDHLLERVQARLTDSSAVVGWLDAVYRPGSHDNPSWIYVIRRRGPVRWIELQAEPGEIPPSARSDVLHKRLELAAGWPFAIAQHDDITRGLRECWAQRFGPAESLLAGVRELIVVSPQVNDRVPLELEVDPLGRPLNERFAISYSPSALHFACSPAPDRGGRVRGSWSGLIVRAPGRLLPNGEDDLRWCDREVDQLVNHLKRPRVLIGAAASEVRIRGLASAGELQNAQLVHIASHASGGEGWIHQVWLALAESAGGTRARADSLPDRDGFLSVSDVTGWRLHAHLVTLAGCKSAGLAVVQTEGLVGLGQGFVQAGARSVVVSLWAVDDEATGKFMEFFYSALFAERARPCSVAEALREARERLRNYRDEQGRRPYEHPARWGAFVLLGDPG